MKETYRNIISALRTKTGKNTQLVFKGQIFNSLIGFLLNILLLRYLNVQDYGLFSLFSAVLMLLSGFMHFGWAETYVRFGSKYFNKPEFPAIRKFILNRILLCGGILAILAFIFAPWLSNQVYRRMDFIFFFRLASIGAFFTCLLSFFNNDYRVRQRFGDAVSLQLGASSARLLFCLIFLLLGMLTLYRVVAIYLWVPLLMSIVYLIGFFLSSYASSTHLDRHLQEEMGAFNIWVLVTLIATNIIGNIDAHILAHFHDNSVLSAHGAALRLAVPIQFTIISITTTILPRLNAAQSDAEIHFYLSRLKLFIIPLVLCFLFAFWLGPPILIWMAGEKYSHIGHLIQLQILTSFVDLITTPVGLVLWAWGLSKGFAYLNIAQVFVDLLLDLLWIPKWGAAGAISATLVVNAMGTVFIYSSLWYHLRKRRIG